MAEATKSTKVVREDEFTLKLTTDEAETLTAILAKVGGDSKRTPRGHAETIAKALALAGVRNFTADGEHPFKYLNGSLMFHIERQRRDRPAF
jgi:hypothetical protein